jgi:hypothetical protein
MEYDDFKCRNRVLISNKLQIWVRVVEQAHHILFVFLSYEDIVDVCLLLVSLWKFLASFELHRNVNTLPFVCFFIDSLSKQQEVDLSFEAE